MRAGTSVVRFWWFFRPGDALGGLESDAVKRAGAVYQQHQIEPKAALRTACSKRADRLERRRPLAA